MYIYSVNNVGQRTLSYRLGVPTSLFFCIGKEETANESTLFVPSDPLGREANKSREMEYLHPQEERRVCKQ